MGGSSTVPKEPAREESTLEGSRFVGATGLAGAGAGAGVEVGAGLGAEVDALVGDTTGSGSSVVAVMGAGAARGTAGAERTTSNLPG